MIKHWLSFNTNTDQIVTFKQTLLAALAAFLVTPVLCFFLAFPLSWINSYIWSSLTLENITKWVFFGTFSPILSWIGFLFLIPTFWLLHKTNAAGWLPVTSVGALIGAISPMLVDGVPHNTIDILPFTIFGAAHAGLFWVALTLINTRKPKQA